MRYPDDPSSDTVPHRCAPVAEIVLDHELLRLLQAAALGGGDVVDQMAESVAGLAEATVVLIGGVDLRGRLVDPPVGLLDTRRERVRGLGHEVELDIEVVDVALAQHGPQRTPIEPVLALPAFSMMIVEGVSRGGGGVLGLGKLEPRLAKGGGGAVFALAPAGEELLQIGEHQAASPCRRCTLSAKPVRSFSPWRKKARIASIFLTASSAIGSLPG